MRRFCLSLFALLALAPASASAAPGWDFEKVALSGDLAPEAGGAAFTLFAYVGLDDDGVVSFEAALSDGRSGIFVAMPGGTPVPSVTPRGIVMLVVLLTSIATASLANRD